MGTPGTPPASFRLYLAEVGTCDACLRSGRQRVNVGLALAATLPGTYLGFFGYAAVVILASAERFADGLVQTGQQFGISPFFLVQFALAALEPGSAELIALSVAYLILAAVLM